MDLCTLYAARLEPLSETLHHPFIMEGPDYLRFVLALAFVLALMGIVAHLLKRFGSGRFSLPSKNDKRLTIIETRMVDTRHKLALVKCDDQEHLLLISPESQCVIQTNIKKAASQ